MKKREKKLIRHPLIEELEELEEPYTSSEESVMDEREKLRYTMLMVNKIGLEEVKVDEEVEIEIEEGVGVEEIKILLDFLFLMKIQSSQ